MRNMTEHVIAHTPRSSTRRAARTRAQSRTAGPLTTFAAGIATALLAAVPGCLVAGSDVAGGELRVAIAGWLIVALCATRDVYLERPPRRR